MGRPWGARRRGEGKGEMGEERQHGLGAAWGEGGLQEGRRAALVLLVLNVLSAIREKEEGRKREEKKRKEKKRGKKRKIYGKFSKLENFQGEK
jgi:hypothetical protein